MYSVGERIKQRRKELGLTQGELAERMGYTVEWDGETQIVTLTSADE